MNKESKEAVQKIEELGNEISKLLKEHYTPHHKVEINTTSIKLTSDAWKLLSDEGKRFLEEGNK